MFEPAKNISSGEPISQLFRYGLIGIATNAALYFFYLLITYLGIEPKLSMTFAYIVGVFLGYIGHRNWTFGHKGALLGSSARYFIAHAFGYLINYVILLEFVDKLGYPHQWVQATAIIVVAGFLFVTFRYFVFPKAESCIRDH